jgi:flagellar motor switch protein FliM
MSNINEQNIQQWGLSVSDTLSSKLKSDINLQGFKSDELNYGTLLDNSPEGNWISVFMTPEQKTIITIIHNKSIIAITESIFLSNLTEEKENKVQLSFTEKFIAEKITEEMTEIFKLKQIDLEFVRNESKKKFVHTFLTNETITNYQFNVHIGGTHYGDLNICHAHVL